MLLKNDIRLNVENRIEKMTHSEKQKESQEISSKLIEILSGESYETLITYDPMDDEVDICGVNSWAQQNGKKVIILGQTQLGIPAIQDEKNTLCIVVGRAFTQDGKRIGRGVGFYDRMLEMYPQMMRIGVCFSCQIFEELPQDDWDQTVSRIVFIGNILE